jgi:HEAT repeat protein
MLRDAAAKADEDNVRAFAILSLGRLNDRESLEPLTRFLEREKQANIRRSSAIALGKIATAADTEAVALLFRALDDADPVTRHFAAVSLGDLADDDIRETLRKSLPTSPRADRPFYALALGIAGNADGGPVVRAALRAERVEDLKSGYCIALGLMGDVDAVPLLEKAARERGEIWLPGYAALSLGMIGSRSSAPMRRERLADENDPRLRMNLAVALGLMHDPAARTFLVDTVQSPKGSILERGSAAMAIGVLRMNDATDDLLAVYRDKKEQDIVRALTVVALGVLADPSPIPKLSRFAIDHNYGVNVDPLNEVLSIL